MNIPRNWHIGLVLACSLLANLKAGATGYTLTANAVGSGSIIRNPTNSVYPAGVVVTLTAVSNNPNWYFSGWSGDASGTNNPFNLLMDGNKNVTATFQQFASFSLTTITNGHGAIALDPPDGVYLSNTLVTITATPEIGWVFASWSGSATGNVNPLSVTMQTNLSLTANFAQLPAFDVQPQNATNWLGSNVVFTAHAVGTAPLSYQWFFNNSPVNGATNHVLAITNIALTNAGSYWVVAINDYSSATSSVVSLVVTSMSGSTNVVSVCDEASLRAAIQIGGWISITCSGTIALTKTITITNQVSLDAEGGPFIISGKNQMRLFYVAPGASIFATNVIFADGLVTNHPADGGAIYNNGGTVGLVSCVLTNNGVQDLVYGGVARGGAVFNNGGSLMFNGSYLSDNTVVAGIANPNFPGANGGLGFGGAVFSTNGPVNMENCTVNSNSCTAAGGANGGCFGGGVFLGAGSSTISESSFANNFASGGASPPPSAPDGPIPAYGGALAVISGDVVIDLSQFSGNTAKGGDSGGHTSVAPGLGGAVYSTSALIAKNSSFVGNRAVPGIGGYPQNNPNALANGYGGGLYNAGMAILDRCSICSNFVQGATPVVSFLGIVNGADGLGGGIFNASQLVTTNCTIAFNEAMAGIGTPGSPTDITGTNGAALGGGIYNSTNAVSTLMNNTIASNYCIATAPDVKDGLAAGVEIANTNGTVRLKNTIIAYGGTNGNVYGFVTDDGFNICSDGSANLQSGASYNFTDPRLGRLGYYGGPTSCMPLLPNSPAIDSGNNSGAPNTDQRGYPRPNSGIVDIGAYEFYYPNQSIAAGPRLALTLTANGMQVTYTAFPSILYHFQVSTNLTSWTDMGTDGPFSAITNVSRNIGDESETHQFYRLLQE